MSTQTLKAVATGQGSAEKAPTIFDFLEHTKVRKGITAVAGKYLKAERMLTLCVNAVKKTPRLLQCDPQSVLGAMMTSAALGLEPNTAQQQAFLIPYRKRVPPPDGGRHWVETFECQLWPSGNSWHYVLQRPMSRRRVFTTDSTAWLKDIVFLATSL
ncbi:recombinase RecT [Azohydromonas australica]|uniref:recombinase RecT n=1 Tax=Azohydromonas australica TaxID=364039 RepID=UPI0003FBD5D0|nr:recombinase RecT [Azohydromonas australica]